MYVPNFDKRVKRKIKARKHGFFAVFPPGFQNEIIDEFSRYEAEIVSIENGGIEFVSSIQECIRINLKSASLVRVLMRICEFRAILFSELRRSVSEIEWELYLDRNVPLNLSISCRGSRLYHTGRIETEVRKGIRKRFSDVTGDDTDFENKKGFQTLFVRINNNRVVVSIDSTGSPLYMRNIRTEVSGAPLRENIAYLLLKKAGIGRYDAIVDPMAGTGTFSIEWYLAERNIPPGLQRSFAFEYWPVFSRAAFDYMKREFCLQSTDIKIFASDISEKNVKSINSNFRRAGIDSTAEKHDFFDLRGEYFGENIILVLNPPYGKRLGEVSETMKLYSRISEKIKKDFTNCSYILLCPEHVSVGKLELDYDEIACFLHGGIRINTIIRRRK